MTPDILALPPLTDRGTPLEQLLTRVVDGGLAAVVLISPWFMGGKHPLGELVLVSLSVLVAVAWVVKQAVGRGQAVWKIGAAELVILFGLALVVFQLTPLPDGVAAWLSPPIGRLLPVWDGRGYSPERLGVWSQLSLSPDSTRAGLTLYIAYALLFMVASQRIAKVDDVERLLRWMALSAVLLAIVGLLQYMTSNGKFLWVYDSPFSNTNDAVKGPFANKNHFAHLLALGVGPLVWLVQQSMSRLDRPRRYDDNDNTPSLPPAASADLEWLVMVNVIGLGVVIFAGLMTFSRGGSVALLLATATSLGLLLRAGMLTSRFVLTSGAVFMFFGGVIGLQGLERVADRMRTYGTSAFDDVSHPEQSTWDRLLWKADISAARDFATVGSGVGTHREVHRLYLDETSEGLNVHACNSYLQIALETGVPGLLLALAGIGIAAYWCLAAMRNQKEARLYTAGVAVASALLASVVQSSVDHVWYVSSLMAFTVLLLACAARLMEIGREGRRRWTWYDWHISRQSLAAAAGLLLIVGVWMMHDRFCAAMAAPAWDRLLAYSNDCADRGVAEKPSPALLQELQTVLHYCPQDGRAHARLARYALLQFDQEQRLSATTMTLDRVRENVSRLRSRLDQQAWMKRNVARPELLTEALTHAHMALRRGPLYARAYLHLSDLAFLENPAVEVRSAWLDQALLVGPREPEITMVAAREYWLRAVARNDAASIHDRNTALELWRRAYRAAPAYREAIIRMMSVGGANVLDVLDRLQPQWPEIEIVRDAYRGKMTVSEERRLSDAYAVAATRKPTSVR